MIETNRYKLKKIEKDSAKNLFHVLSNEKIIANLNMSLHKTMEDTYQLLEEYEKGFKEGTKFPFEILKKDTNEWIGVFLLKLDYYDEDCFEFTIYLDEPYWGQGIYTEILPYMVTYAFEKIGTGNVRGFVMEKNVASARVLAKSGFSLEKKIKVPGIEGEVLSYLMTKKEYDKKKI